MDTPLSGVNTWLTMQNRPLIFGERENAFKEGREYIISSTPQAPADIFISIGDPPLDRTDEGDWIWRVAKGYAGLYELRMEVNVFEDGEQSRQVHVALIRIFPQKLSLRRHRAMLTDLNTITTDILCCLYSPSQEKLTVRQSKQTRSSLREYLLIKEIISELQSVMAHISSSPHHVLSDQVEMRLLQEVRQFTHDTSPLTGSPNIALPSKVHSIEYLPVSWLVREKVLTYDVYENRLLKHFLQQLFSKLQIIQDNAKKERDFYQQELEKNIAELGNKFKFSQRQEMKDEIEKLDTIIKNCRDWERQCMAWMSEPFLTSVRSGFLSGDATQVLLKHPFYSSFYRLYLLFQEDLQLNLSTAPFFTTLASRKTIELYELWSVFTVMRVIVDMLLNEAGYIHVSNNVFQGITTDHYEIRQDLFRFHVRKNTPSIKLRHREKDIRVEMKYGPVYPPSHMVRGKSSLVSMENNKLTPDMAIEIYCSDVPQHVIIFDAKYRDELKYCDELKKNAFVPVEDDIDITMRHYCNNIRYQVHHSTRQKYYKPQKIVSSAHILYPGEVIRHFKKENDVAMLGALPLRPEEMDESITEGVLDTLADILHRADLL